MNAESLAWWLALWRVAAPALALVTFAILYLALREMGKIVQYQAGWLQDIQRDKGIMLAHMAQMDTTINSLIAQVNAQGERLDGVARQQAPDLTRVYALLDRLTEQERLTVGTVGTLSDIVGDIVRRENEKLQ